MDMVEHYYTPASLAVVAAMLGTLFAPTSCSKQELLRQRFAKPCPSKVHVMSAAIRGPAAG